jgi:hypothetical protein
VSHRAFPRSVQEPSPGSRHLHAGHRLANQRAPARLIPEPQLRSGFDVVCSVSTLQRWFACARLPGPHLKNVNIVGNVRCHTWWGLNYNGPAVSVWIRPTRFQQAWYIGPNGTSHN